MQYWCVTNGHTIGYDTIEEFNVDSKLSIQLNVAHVARN